MNTITQNLLETLMYHISISTLANDSFQPREDMAICPHLQKLHLFSHFEYFSILFHESKKYFLELTEYLLIVQDA